MGWENTKAGGCPPCLDSSFPLADAAAGATGGVVDSCDGGGPLPDSNSSPGLSCIMFLASLLALPTLGRPILPSPRAAGTKGAGVKEDPCAGATGAALGKALAPSPSPPPDTGPLLPPADSGLLVTGTETGPETVTFPRRISKARGLNRSRGGEGDNTRGTTKDSFNGYHIS